MLATAGIYIGFSYGFSLLSLLGKPKPRKVDFKTRDGIAAIVFQTIELVFVALLWSAARSDSNIWINIDAAILALGSLYGIVLSIVIVRSGVYKRPSTFVTGVWCTVSLLCLIYLYFSAVNA